jgi:hypothetical protein
MHLPIPEPEARGSRVSGPRSVFRTHVKETRYPFYKKFLKLIGLDKINKFKDLTRNISKPYSHSWTTNFIPRNLDFQVFIGTINSK